MATLIEHNNTKYGDLVTLLCGAVENGAEEYTFCIDDGQHDTNAVSATIRDLGGFTIGVEAVAYNNNEVVATARVEVSTRTCGFGFWWAKNGLMSALSRLLSVCVVTINGMPGYRIQENIVAALSVMVDA